MITREQLDESLERFTNRLLFEIGQFRDDADRSFRAIEVRLDRQAGLIQSGARALLRFDRWSDTADERIMEMADHIQVLEGRLAKLKSHP
jgi:hypothetical protein